ncbi:MAG: redoxin domain-containing protein [Chloroflexi bacterium]|nr:redoxin domain-containing protein [Chloroflexota bacterium]
MKEQRQQDTRDRFAGFRHGLRVQDKAPAFTLQDLSGAPVSLADFAGTKHVVLEFGAIT